MSTGHTLMGRALTPFVVLALTQLSPAQTVRPREIAQRSLPSVVLLVINKGGVDGTVFGSGFFVGRDLVATNYHVVEGGVNGYARIVGQEARYDIEGFVGLDSSNDLALVKLRQGSGKPLPLGNSSSVAIGDDVFAVGNPEGLEGTFSQGIVSSIRRDGNDSLIQITAPISHGSSGGPVLNSRGEVVGVAVGGVADGQALNFAIPVSFLHTLIANRQPLITFAAALKNLVGDVAAGSESSLAKAASHASSKTPSLSTDEVPRDRGRIAAMPGAITSLTITSDRGDYIGGGKSYTYKIADGRFFSEARDMNQDGVPDFVKIEFRGKDGSRWTLQFATRGIDANMSYGTYEDAQQAAFADASPGLDISHNSSSCGRLLGSFRVFDAQFDYSAREARVTSFAATFEQYCEGKAAGLRGTIYFNALPINDVK